MNNAVNAKNIHRAWSMYDWANSAYNLVITSTIFPAYYAAVTVTKLNGVEQDTVHFFGWNIKNTALFDYAVAAAYLLIAVLSPILSSIADVKGSKKSFLRLFCYVGALACAGLYFFDGKNIEYGILLFAIAAVGYCGSLVFYNSYLPQIAKLEDRDRLSAQGFAYGYVGSVILQLICFLFVLKPEWFGISDSTFPARLSFLLVGAWWFLFAQIPLKILPSGERKEGASVKSNVLTDGFKELKKVWQQVQNMPVLKLFLLAFFFYSMGVQTVMLAATLFGSKELKLETSQLIAVILIIQLVAIAGAYVMAKLSEKYGNFKILSFVIVVWIAMCIGAYFTTTANEFYILAVIVGLVMGGIQSLSRSTFSKLMPETKDTTSFFSFYDVTEKLAIVIGMFTFGFLDHITGNMRMSIVSLILFFLVGFIVLIIAQKKNKNHLKARENLIQP